VLPAGDSAPASQSVLESFVAQAKPGGYIALCAYVTPSPQMDAALARLRAMLGEETGLPVTVGYGPRFLHSTGQLHKGDAGKGLFVLLTTDPIEEVPIPDEPGGAMSSLTFGALKLAQALGDDRALRQACPPRRVIRFHLGTDAAQGIAALLG
jgi:hypothetical protein